MEKINTRKNSVPENKIEIERIQKAYERRKKIPPQLYSFFNPGHLFMAQRKECEILDTLKKYNIVSLEDKKILEVGCGEGIELRNLIRYDAKPENLYGIDLLSDSIAKANKLNSNINFLCNDASKLPYKDNFFDIVMQVTVFTSIFNSDMKKYIASEMLRVLKPDGIIIWYDFYVNNPKNPDVKGVKKKEVCRLFPDCNIYLKRITLAPPLARFIAPYSTIICQLLEKIPFICLHYLGIIKKK